MKKQDKLIFRPAGFTLIELIIVLVIIGIATGLAGIYIGSSSDSLAIKTFTKEVSAILRYARNHAASEKVTYHFLIDTEEKMYRLYADQVVADKPLVTINKPIPEELEVIVENTGDDVFDIKFFPRGNSSGGIFEVRSEKGGAYVISVNRITGKAEIEKE